MRFWLRAVVVVALLTALFAIHSSPAFAAPDAVSAAVERIYSTEMANANFGDAQKKLKGLTDRCNRDGCSPRAVAQLHVATGIVLAQVGKTEEARAEFAEAIDTDETVPFPSQASISATTRALFAAVKNGGAAPAPSPATAPPVVPPASASVVPNSPEDPTTASWSNRQAQDYARQAVVADNAGNLVDCIEREKAALQLEEQARARLHLASCEERSSKVIDALRDTQRVLAAGIQRNDTPIIKAAQSRINALLPRIVKISFEPPAGVDDLKVTFDERPVPKEKLGQKFSIDPGSHKIHAEGTNRGVLLAFDDTRDFKDGENVAIKLTLKPTAITEGQIACMFAAKTQEDILNCLPKDKKPLVVRAGVDIGAYTDSTSVQVLSPGINASVSAPTSGWNIGGSYLVDIVSAASPDVISTASHNFRDLRQAGTLSGGYKPGNYGAQANVGLSVEHDYVSRSGGLTLIGDFFDKRVTPSIGYFRTEDTIGRADTPYSVFSNHLSTNEVQLGSAFVLSPLSVLQLGVSLQSERGDQSKPYRYVPLFAEGIGMGPGASFTDVNRYRLPVRPLEQLPLDRDRWAFAIRYIRRIGNSTLRGEERLYYDTWQSMASSTDLRYLIDITRRLRVGPHARFHLQNSASFYQRKYIATINPDGSLDLPKYRTTDRELSRLFSLTGGGSLRFALSQPESKTQFGVQLDADAMYTHYNDALYIKSRLALWSVLRFDVEFQ